MFLELVRVVFGRCEGKARRDDAFDPMMKLLAITTCDLRGLVADARRIVGQVEEQRNAFHASILFKVFREEAACFQVDTHSTEDNGEVLFMVVMNGLCWFRDETGLSANLCSNFIVRKTSSREDGDFLATGNRVHGVDGRDTGRDHFFGINLTLSAVLWNIDSAHKDLLLHTD